MAPSLTLGTANLGLAYGTAIRRDLPSAEHAETMLRRARKLGFAAVDTAAAYGESETRIGRHLVTGRGFTAAQVGTKIAPLDELAPSTAPATARRLAAASLDRSRRALGVERLQRVLLHRASQLELAGGAVWRSLLVERAAGRIVELGVSVQSWREARTVLGRTDVDVVQLPCNILDWRFDSAAMRRLVSTRRTPVAIEVRSVFLQGVLVTRDHRRWPEIPRPYARADTVAWLRGAAERFADGALDALCLRYVASLPWADAIVVGADDVGQLDRLAAIATLGPFAPEVVEALRRSRPHLPAELLNPALWR
jgi:spore coat polysaccharide biosynthesis protein SpsF